MGGASGILVAVTFDDQEEEDQEEEDQDEEDQDEEDQDEEGEHEISTDIRFLWRWKSAGTTG